jgi:hypothetical protein
MDSSAIQNPISRMSDWYSTAVKNREATDAQKNQEAEEARRKEKEHLYDSTLEKFESGFEKLSQLDGSTRFFSRDSDDKPGSVKVASAGSLTKTADGFEMQLVSHSPMSFVGMALVPGALAVPTGRLKNKKEVFTVNEKANTILYQEFEVESLPALARLRGQQGSDDPVEFKTLKKSHTLNLNTHELTENPTFEGFSGLAGPVPLGVDRTWQNSRRGFQESAHRKMFVVDGREADFQGDRNLGKSSWRDEDVQIRKDLMQRWDSSWNKTSLP